MRKICRAERIREVQILRDANMRNYGRSREYINLAETEEAQNQLPPVNSSLNQLISDDSILNESNEPLVSDSLIMERENSPDYVQTVNCTFF